MNSHGPGAIKDLTASYNGEPKAWIFPPPTRAGFVFPVALAMWVTGTSDETAGARLSVVFSLLALALLYGIGARFFGAPVAAIATLLLAVSPLDLAISRRCWQDGLMFLLTTAMMACGALHLQRSRKTLWIAGLALLAGYSVWIKESAWASSALCALWVCIAALLSGKGLRAAWPVAVFTPLMMVLGFLLLAHLAGGLGITLEMLGHTRDSIPLNEYARDYQSGPWWTFVQGMWMLSPVSVLLFFSGILWATIGSKAEGSWLFFKNRELAWGFLGLLISFTALMSLPAGFKNLRYLSPFYGVYYLCAGWGGVFWMRLVRAKSGPVSRPFLGLALIAGFAITMFGDYWNFRALFVTAGVRDPVVRQFYEARTALEAMQDVEKRSLPSEGSPGRP